MTLGDHPEGVEPEYRLPLEAFGSGADFPRFKNVAPALGIDTFNLSGGAVVDDFDGDTDLDIFTTTFDPSGEPRFFVGDGAGGFEDRTSAAGLKGLYGGLNVVHGDYDNDGDLDLFVGNEHSSGQAAPSQLLPQRGRGAGRCGPVPRCRRGSRRRGPRLCQGGGVGRLRQRSLPRPLRLGAGRGESPLPQPRGRQLRGRGRRTRRRGASPELPGVVLGRRQRRQPRPVRVELHRRPGRPGLRSRELPGIPGALGAGASLPEHGRRPVRGCRGPRRPDPAPSAHGIQLRRPGRGRFPRLLPWHRLSGLRGGDAQRPVPQPGRRAVRRCQPRRRLRPLAEGARGGVRRHRLGRRPGRVRADGRRLPGRRLR